MKKVGLIDYKAGNIQSIANAISHVGADIRIVRGPDEIDGITHLVLPGVGAFGFCVDRLQASGLVPALETWALTRSLPILGICVGMQLLSNSSEENGLHSGLGWVGGVVDKLKSSDPCIRIPHVGWNNVTFESDFGEYRKGSQADFYFDHSYAYILPDNRYVLAGCEHGQYFCAGVQKDNIIGVQFHPEKSQEAGLRFLRSFLAL